MYLKHICYFNEMLSIFQKEDNKSKIYEKEKIIVLLRKFFSK